MAFSWPRNFSDAIGLGRQMTREQADLIQRLAREPRLYAALRDGIERESDQPINADDAAQLERWFRR